MERLAGTPEIQHTPSLSGIGYIMEGPDEAVRLEAKTDPEVAQDQLRLSGLREGMRALDVGCGTGAVARLMARLAGPAPVVGLDRNCGRLSTARKLAAASGLDLRFVAGDAYRLPFFSASFDFTWCRFLFEYLAHPERALAEMVRVTGAGGIIAVADLDGQVAQFHPLPEELRADLDQALALLATTGFDPWVGRKLYSFFVRAGLQKVSVRVLPYQVYAGGIPARELPNWRIKIATLVELLSRATDDPVRWESLGERLLGFLSSREMFYYCSLVLVCGHVPPR